MFICLNIQQDLGIYLNPRFSYISKQKERLLLRVGVMFSSFLSKPRIPRSSRPKVFLKISQNSQENACASLFSNKVAGPGLQLY